MPASTRKPGRPKFGQPLPAEHLEEVAAVYREALSAGERPTKAVCERWGVPQPTGARWVMRAREAGMLPPASRGRANA